MESNQTSSYPTSLDTKIQLPNDVSLLLIARVKIQIREINGIPFINSVSEWEVSEFVKKMYPKPVVDMKIKRKDKISILLSVVSSECDAVVESFSNVKSGLGNRAVEVIAQVYDPKPRKSDWEQFFYGHLSPSPSEYSALEPGYRPDTIMLQDLPSLWFEIESADISKCVVTREHVLYKFFAKFGRIASMAVIASDATSAIYFTLGIQYHDYESFQCCMSALKSRVIQKVNVSKMYLLNIDFDHFHYFSESARKERKRISEQRQQAVEEEKAKQQKEIQFIQQTKQVVQYKLESLEQLLSECRGEFHSHSILQQAITYAEELNSSIHSSETLSRIALERALGEINKWKKEVSDYVNEDRKRRKRERERLLVKGLSHCQEMWKEYQEKSDDVSELSFMEKERERLSADMQVLSKMQNSNEKRDVREEDGLANHLLRSEKEWTALLESQHVLSLIEEEMNEHSQVIGNLKNVKVDMMIVQQKSNVKTPIDMKDIVCKLMDRELQSEYESLNSRCISLQDLKDSYASIQERIGSFNDRLSTVHPFLDAVDRLNQSIGSLNELLKSPLRHRQLLLMKYVSASRPVTVLDTSVSHSVMTAFAFLQPLSQIQSLAEVTQLTDFGPLTLCSELIDLFTQFIQLLEKRAVNSEELVTVTGELKTACEELKSLTQPLIDNRKVLPETLQSTVESILSVMPELPSTPLDASQMKILPQSIIQLNAKFTQLSKKELTQEILSDISDSLGLLSISVNAASGATERSRSQLRDVQEKTREIRDGMESIREQVNERIVVANHLKVFLFKQKKLLQNRLKFQEWQDAQKRRTYSLIHSEVCIRDPQNKENMNGNIEDKRINHIHKFYDFYEPPSYVFDPENIRHTQLLENEAKFHRKRRRDSMHDEPYERKRYDIHDSDVSEKDRMSKSKMKFIINKDTNQLEKLV